MLSIDIEEFLEGSKHIRQLSSPGPDSLPHGTLDPIVKYPPLYTLINVIYNEALQKSKFPKSGTSL